MTGTPIGYYAVIEKDVIGLLKIRELKKSLDFFEEAYKYTQGKRYKELESEVRDLRESLEYQEKEHIERLEKLVKAKNPSFF